MMKRFFLLLTLFLAAAASYQIWIEKGLVMLLVNQHRIVVHLPLALVLTSISFYLLHKLINAGYWLKTLPQDLRTKRMQRYARTKHNALQNALMLLLEEQWTSSFQAFQTAASYSTTNAERTLMLSLAKLCAIRANDTRSAQKLTQQLQSSLPSAQEDFCTVQLYLDKATKEHLESHEALIDTLEHLRELQGPLPTLDSQLAKLYLHTGNHEKLLQFCDAKNALSSPTCVKLQTQAHHAQLTQLYEQGHTKACSDYYQQLPSHYRAQPDLKVSYAHTLLHEQKIDEAQALLFEILAKHPSHSASAKSLNYTYINQPLLESATIALGHLAHQHPQNPVLNYAYATLLERIGRFQEAQETLSTLLEYDPRHTPESAKLVALARRKLQFQKNSKAMLEPSSA